MKKSLLTFVTAFLALGALSVAFAQHNHGHFNIKRVRYYVNQVAFNVENLEETLGACTFTPGVDHALGDAEELCELVGNFTLRLKQFNVKKADLRIEFSAIAELAGHMDELIDEDHALHSNQNIKFYWSQIDWYLRRIAFQVGVIYGHGGH